MNGFGSEARELLQSHIDDHGFLSWLGVRVEELEAGRIVMQVPYDERLTNPGIAGRGQTVHGGVAASLIDTAGGLAIRTDLPDPFTDGVATIDLNVSYLRPARGDLVATAEVVRVGTTVGVADVRVRSTTPGGENGEDDVAVGRGSYRVFR